MTELFDKHGKPTTDESKACAKRASRETNSTILGEGKTVTRYYVKYSGYLYDPVQMSPVDERYRSWKMREVNQRVFDIYLEFLQTHKEHFRINAERLINAQS